MKTLILMSLLTVGCGRFDEEGSKKDPVSVADEKPSLWDIAKKPLENDEYSMDLQSILIHEFQVKGDINVVSEYWKTADGKKKSKFFKKNADGSLKDCNVIVFIAIIHNAKNSGEDYGSLRFASAYDGNPDTDPCGMVKGVDWTYAFVNGEVEIKNTLE